MKTSASISLMIFACCASSFAGPERMPDNKDMKQAVVEPACPIDWTGFHIGIHAGYGFNSADTSITPLPIGLAPSGTTADPNPDGFVGGLQLGYDHQWGGFVLGVEGDFSGSTIDGTKSFTDAQIGADIRVHQDTDWFGTFRGRVGFTPVCRLLLYGTGGLAFGDVNYSASILSLGSGALYAASPSETRVGWTGGGGGELALTKRWSVKLEVLYYDLGDKTFTANPVPPNPPFQTRYNSETTGYTVNGGVNFHF